MNDPTMNLEEALRRTLQAGTAPEALRRRLREEAHRQDSHHLRSWIFLAAASLLLTIAGLGLWRGLSSDPALRLAQQAFAEYNTEKRLDFTGEPLAQGKECACSQWSKCAVGFAAPMPSCIPSCCIQGGRGIQLNQKPVAVYLLDAKRALYVFREPIPRQDGAPGKRIHLPSFGQARVWNEDGRGYVLLEGKVR